MSTTDLLRTLMPDVKAMAFDGCHRMYLLLDDEQVATTAGYGYGEDGSHLVMVEQTDEGREAAIDTLADWWVKSCGLRFINAVRTAPNPNDGFSDVIEQGGKWL